jgi:hypothetical protein
MAISNSEQLETAIVSAERTSSEQKLHAEAFRKLRKCLESLSINVNNMSALYDEHPFLNDAVNLEKIIPMSLDEWSTALYNWLNP